MISRIGLVQAMYDATWGKFVFAGAYDRFLKRSEQAGLALHRSKLVSQAAGRTLEIATGTGLNLPYYSDAVTDLVLTEPYPPMAVLLREKVAVLNRNAQVIEATAESLPFPNHSFDTVVGTMILCTADNPESVLREVGRVLKPGGQYLFLEHIRNPNPSVAKKQDRVQPLWYLFGNGCHCNRDSVKTLTDSPLKIEELSYDHIPQAWAIIEAMVRGRARQPYAAAPSGQMTTQAETLAPLTCCEASCGTEVSP